jgi:hypothetical protein
MRGSKSYPNWQSVVRSEHQAICERDVRLLLPAKYQAKLPGPPAKTLTPGPGQLQPLVGR